MLKTITYLKKVFIINLIVNITFLILITCNIPVEQSLNVFQNFDKNSKCTNKTHNTSQKIDQSKSYQLECAGFIITNKEE